MLIYTAKEIEQLAQSETRPTREEFEKSAFGIDTGYRDMRGTPIRIGDPIVYYKKCTRRIDDDDDIRIYPKWMVYGQGFNGYVYTGRVQRRFYVVNFDLEHGFEIVPGCYAYLNETDDQGNLKTLLVCERDEAPKYSLEQLQGVLPK